MMEITQTTQEEKLAMATAQFITKFGMKEMKTRTG
jgi:hypothetical protein